MKNLRNSDGYVLAYLLVIIAVMGIFSATLMSSTVKVVQNQQASIERMKDQYAAQGEIEKMMAEFEAISDDSLPKSGLIFSSEGTQSDGDYYEHELAGAINNAISNLAGRLASEFTCSTLRREGFPSQTPYTTTFEFETKSNCGSTEIVATLSVSFEIHIISDTYETDDESAKYTLYGYNCKKTPISVKGYEISSVTSP